MINELTALDMPAPKFVDGGIYFTVILNSVLAIKPAKKITGMHVSNTDLVLAVLREGPKSKAEIQQATHMTYGKTKYAVEKLLREKRIYKIGKNRSPNTVYVPIFDE